MQSQQLKTEELEQNKLNGLSTKTFYNLYTEKKIWGKEVTSIQSAEKEILIILYFWCIMWISSGPMTTVVRNFQRQQSVDSAKLRIQLLCLCYHFLNMKFKI